MHYWKEYHRCKVPFFLSACFLEVHDVDMSNCADFKFDYLVKAVSGIFFQCKITMLHLAINICFVKNTLK